MFTTLIEETLVLAREAHQDMQFRGMQDDQAWNTYQALVSLAEALHDHTNGRQTFVTGRAILDALHV